MTVAEGVIVTGYCQAGDGTKDHNFLAITGMVSIIFYTIYTNSFILPFFCFHVVAHFSKQGLQVNTTLNEFNIYSYVF
jgi:hypothetical protein